MSLFTFKCLVMTDAEREMLRESSLDKIFCNKGQLKSLNKINNEE